MADRTPEQPQKPSPAYDRLLKGEISSKEYVQALKTAQTGRYVERQMRARRATSA